MVITYTLRYVSNTLAAMERMNWWEVRNWGQCECQAR